MSNEITFEGVQYISSKRASEISGYSQDYIGQLARAGKIIGRRVGGLWYIVSDSLSGYKQVAETYTPVPPIAEISKDAQDSSLVTFEGRTYVSAARAAKLTSYHQDYVGQLARGGKILSRQVGKRWYVDVEVLKAHKKEKDALLGAVQASSVGLERPNPPTNEAYTQDSNIDQGKIGLHYTYNQESKPLVPVIEEKEEEKEEKVREGGDALRGTNTIPIRVVRSSIQHNGQSPVSERIRKKKHSRIPVLSIFLKVFPIFVIMVLVFLVYNFSPSLVSIPTLKAPSNFAQVPIFSKESIHGFKQVLLDHLSKEIRYSR